MMKRIYFYLILLVIPAIIGIIYYDILNGKVKERIFYMIVTVPL